MTMQQNDPGDRIVRLAKPRDAQEAEFYRAALEAQGIPCRVVGNYLAAGGLVGWGAEVPELWVFERDVERATGVLNELRQSPEPGG
jgi:hypothetical protein